MLRDDFFFAVECFRTHLLSKHHAKHSTRLKKDRDDRGLSAAELALEIHIAAASGEWCDGLVNAVKDSNPGIAKLKRWRAVVYDPETELFHIRPELNKVHEKIFRGFMSELTRCEWLWKGGVYRSASLLSNEPQIVESTVAYFKSVAGLLRLELYLAADDTDDPEVEELRD